MKLNTSPARAGGGKLPGGVFKCAMCSKLRPNVGKHIRFVDGLRAYVCWRHRRADS